jgi:predicted nucleotide-binding protein (sugar kinase/HSP70/actin superfamily)
MSSTYCPPQVETDKSPPCGFENSADERSNPAGAKSRFRPQHYRRPAERPFTAAERGKVTILIGGLTRKHERFIKAVFEGSGYACEILPTPDQAAFQIGKEFGNNGQCSPAYFTAGSLIQFLKNLEAGGMPREEINDRFLFFTAGSCGPCRFGMYAAEYRMALQNAGFDGFRVLRFQQDEGVYQKSGGEGGLKYTVDFGLGMLKIIFLGDILNDLATDIRPFEMVPGETDRVMNLCAEDLSEHLKTFKPPDFMGLVPRSAAKFLSRHKILRHTLGVIHKLRAHLYGKEFREVMERCRRRINTIEVDRTRVRPVIKIIGEFWAQTTEGDGNYRMFEFLEREGAHVRTEILGTWVTYLLAHAQIQMHPRRGLDSKCEEPGRRQLMQRLKNELNYQKKLKLLALGEWMYEHEYHRIVKMLGNTAHRLVPQAEFARLAGPFYCTTARGGEGYLEVGKNIYYHTHKLCHMVLSLKPFGCMPSSQSDGIQSTVVSRYKDMIFIPVETSGEGESNAHSRVQMALGEAKAKAKSEFQEVLVKSGKKLEEIRAYVDKHPALRQPLLSIPHCPGIAGVAANFVLYVSDLMDGRAVPRKCD